MKSKYIFKIIIALAAIPFLLTSCADEKEIYPAGDQNNLLRIATSFGISTRLAELPNVNEMATDEFGLKNVGLYIYYTEDYQKGDLSNPYVRNLECTVENGQLIVVLGPNSDPLDKNIFIYDRMTLVAFYPYNEAMSQNENYFATKADEEKYPITRNDYSQQMYIPYRAQTNTDPTMAFYTQMTFYPKHTYKVEIVVVSDDASAFPSTGDVKILPGNDSVDNTNTEADGKRAQWYDEVNIMPNGGGGSNVQQYVTYIWTTENNKNEINKGDILLESGKLTLIASQNLTVDEQNIYRYGYNMSTGEIFIPTSSNLIHDIPTLKGTNDSNGVAYQVCDIDLSSESNWTPLNLVGGRYDGGGHKISNLKINTSESKAGLFGQIQGNTTVCNVNLINPTITVNNNTTDTCYVGALTGRLNTVMSEADKAKLIGNIPGDLSPVVKEALLQEMLAGLLNSQSTIIGCRVENPVISVNGKDPVVGTICGQAGEKDGEGTYKSSIRDTYSLGGSINVNTGNPDNNTNAYVGGFCGLNNGSILRSYTTINTINAQGQTTPEEGQLPVPVDKSTGFTHMGDDFTSAEGGFIENSYSILPDTNNGVQQLPGSWPSGWITYTGKWPINSIAWLNGSSNSFWYSVGSASGTYPTLQWERR